MGKARKLPRKFEMPWGNGLVVEEVGIDTDYNELVIQLLRYDDFDDPALRFCQYWPDGKFQRTPMMLSRSNLAAMRKALKDAPEIRALLRELVKD
jgi:hypothetical protein